MNMCSFLLTKWWHRECWLSSGQYGTPGQRSEGSLQKKALFDTELLGMLSTFMFSMFSMLLYLSGTKFLWRLFTSVSKKSWKKVPVFPVSVCLFRSISLVRLLPTKHIPKRRACSQEESVKAYVVRGHEGSLVFSRYNYIIWLKIG